MKRIAPDYYQDFACIKGDCRHSCCIGWEIDIDDDSLDYFMGLDGEIGKRLRENIETNDEGAHFRLGEHERCPFLNYEGLCDLIIALGEDSLCQICADHPRFRNFWSDREEIGLGLCCEAAAKLVLGRIEPARLIVLDDDGESDAPDDEETDILEIRSEMTAIVQDRRFPLEERIIKLQEYAQIDLGEIDFAHWKAFLQKLERLDENWTVQLENLNKPDCLFPKHLEIPFEQLLVYLIYRHVNFDDDDLSGRIAYCILIIRLISAMSRSGNLDDLCELARLYSSEIEYSDENLSAIIEEIHRLYPQI